MSGHDDVITVAMKRYNWEDVVLCLTRYVNVLRGEEFEQVSDDAPWADELELLARDLESLVHGTPREALNR